MPAGIQVFNADGSLQFDGSNRLMRVLLPTFSTSTAASSVVVPLQGIVVPAVNSEDSAGTNNAGIISTSGGTVSWGAGRNQTGSILVF